MVLQTAKIVKKEIPNFSCFILKLDDYVSNQLQEFITIFY